MSTPLTAELFARAIIASAVSFGDDPAEAMATKHRLKRRSLAPAAVGVAHAAGADLERVAGILGLKASNIGAAVERASPSFVRAREAAREAVAYHLRGLELKARAAPQPRAEPAADVIAIQVGAAVVVFASEPEPAAVAACLVTPYSPAPSRPAPEPAPRKPQGFAAMSPEKRREVAARGGAAIPPDKRSFSRNRDLAMSAGRAGGAASQGGGRPARAMPKGARFVNLGDGVQRIEMKPIAERVARMAKQQLDRGADLAFVAECFDADPEALKAAIDSLTTGEAA